MTRVATQIILSALFAIMAVVTAVWPDWIERVLGVDPDASSGGLEWGIVVGLGTLALVSGVLARRGYLAAKAGSKPGS
jgi:hypothetical protein